MEIPRLNTSFEPAKEDLLNFKPYAEKVQNIIRGLSNSTESIVIGIDGHWGSGKSTFSNMLFQGLESFTEKTNDRRIIKMRYNPWLYSGSEEMLFDFLNQMKKSFYQSESNFKKIGDAILKYSKYLKSVRISGKIGLGEMASLGVSVEPEEILKRLGEDLTNSGDGLIELKEQINKLLEKSDIKLVVFIDDLDRLDKDELFTILKLIKLTAGFHHVVFVVCMDFDMVANSIYHRFGTASEDGQKYLEKIVNIPISLPLIEEIDRKKFVVKLLDKTFDQYKYVDLLEKNMLQGSLHLCDFANPREAIRVINSFTYSLFAIGKEVNVHDLFWVEYLKVKCPALFKELKTIGSILNSSMFFESRVILNNPADLLKESETNRDRIMKEYEQYSTILEMIFPVDKSGTVGYLGSEKQEPVEKLNREKRISHADHYEKYFSFHIVRKVSILGMEKLVKNIQNENFTNAKATYDKLKENADNDVSVLRLLIETMRHPKDAGKTPVELFYFLNEYNETCDLDESENIGIYEVINELVAGLEESDTEHFKAIESLCETTNLATALSFASILASSFPIEIADELMKIVKNRIIAFKRKTYFELLDTNPYYLHQFWSKSNPDELERYLLKRLIDLKQIGHFLKLFVNFWNGKIRGLIGKRAYNLIIELVDSQKLVFKISEVASILKVPDDFSEFDDYSNNSDEQLARQFLYWAEKDPANKG
ncbi:KAP family P-loop NTPase fold protein [Hwangdonia lutea]|uniref:P-loop NTPase fold protein n=1 Tax=Hwangdonia lutea TaxID=3075823 RepID=A0AA97EL87_9FLAO|nr:P-loop NTPase fold protein [Hwangdonia sp. SCSIO 19198]WOD43177.1 P-loop NTPase fold protein [Hwangdonia sp. SCSIO 19198]